MNFNQIILIFLISMSFFGNLINVVGHPMPVVLRRSAERGTANHGWLDTKFTFSFAEYYSPEFQGFGSLRVINEDYISPKNGFGTHPHKNFEIFSYIVSGELTHRDSMGNKETITRNQVQFTSAGKGIRHSEYNEHETLPVHLIQIWVKPKINDLEPSYSTKEFTDEQKRNNLLRIVSGGSEKSDNSIFINNDIHVYASILESGKELTHNLGKDRQAYIHVIEHDGVSLNLRHDNEKTQYKLQSGDGAFLTTINTLKLSNGGEKPVEFLLFDMATQDSKLSDYFDF